MTDKTDPRLGVLTEFLDLQYDEGYNGQGGLADTDVLAAIDATDRAAGIVRVDTRDEALRDRLWDAVDDAIVVWATDSVSAASMRRDVVVDAVLAALREES